MNRQGTKVGALNDSGCVLRCDGQDYAHLGCERLSQSLSPVELSPSVYSSITLFSWFVCSGMTD